MPVRLLLLLTLAILTVPAQAQQKCGPEEGGPPSCEASGPASQSDPEADASAGNPVNLISGNKYQKEVDLPALPGILGLEIVRYYNSALASEQLHFDHDGHLQQIRAASGERLTLFRAPDGKLLHITDPQGRQLRLIYPDRSVAARNDHFRGIQAIESPVGRFEYHHDDTRAGTWGSSLWRQS